MYADAHVHTHTHTPIQRERERSLQIYSVIVDITTVQYNVYLMQEDQLGLALLTVEQVTEREEKRQAAEYS